MTGTAAAKQARLAPAESGARHFYLIEDKFGRPGALRGPTAGNCHGWQRPAANPPRPRIALGLSPRRRRWRRQPQRLHCSTSPSPPPLGELWAVPIMLRWRDRDLRRWRIGGRGRKEATCRRLGRAHGLGRRANPTEPDSGDGRPGPRRTRPCPARLRRMRAFAGPEPHFAFANSGSRNGCEQGLRSRQLIRPRAGAGRRPRSRSATASAAFVLAPTTARDSSSPA